MPPGVRFHSPRYPPSLCSCSSCVSPISSVQKVTRTVDVTWPVGIRSPALGSRSNGTVSLCGLSCLPRPGGEVGPRPRGGSKWEPLGRTHSRGSNARETFVVSATPLLIHLSTVAFFPLLLFSAWYPASAWIIGYWVQPLYHFKGKIPCQLVRTEVSFLESQVFVSCHACSPCPKGKSHVPHRTLHGTQWACNK